MYRVPSALARKVGDKEIYRRPRGLFVAVNPQEKIPRAQHLKGIVINGHIGSLPASQLLRKGLQLLAKREYLAARSSLQKDRGDGQQKSDREKTRYGSAHSFAPAFSKIILIKLCRAYSITREITKIIHPQEAWK